MYKFIARVLIISFFAQGVAADWKIDFSRRQQDRIKMEKAQPVYKAENKSILDMVTERQAPIEDLVIINTKKGFFPARVNLKQNQRYRVHVVNVNEQQKNISFMMDAFSQHHGTYFGEPVVFEIEPRQQGLFDFRCPETAARGQIVINSELPVIESPMESIRLRQPASE
jgi:hypothetical protein